MVVFKGRFYEFHRERVISRPGQPLTRRSGIEIGPEISSEEALRQVGSGKDVYTLGKQEAYRLALQAQNGRAPLEEPPHRPRNPSPTGREDVYFRHFHPGGAHPTDEGGMGHIFFGERGEGF
jgi:hypothetical protein